MNKKQIDEFCEQFATMMMNMDRTTAFQTLSLALGVLWSNGTNLTTTTEAIDSWRVFSVIVEDEIRQHFGRVRYAGPDETYD